MTKSLCQCALCVAVRESTFNLSGALAQVATDVIAVTCLLERKASLSNTVSEAIQDEIRRRLVDLLDECGAPRSEDELMALLTDWGLVVNKHTLEYLSDKTVITPETGTQH